MLPLRKGVTGANGPTKPRCEALCRGLHGTGVLTAATGRTGNTRNAGSPYVHKGRVKAFLKKNPSAKKAEELLSLSRNQLRIMTRLLTGHCHLKGHLFQLRLITSPKRDRCMQASESSLTGSLLLLRLWPHYDSGSWVVILWNQVTMRTSLLAGYCTLFKVQGC